METMPAKQTKTAILIGATGLVGSRCVELLLQSSAYRKVVTVSRRPLGMTHRKLEQIETPFEQLGEVIGKLSADDVFCCLGTTIRQAGTKAEFHKVDYGYALEFADGMRKNGASHLLLVSALGAHPHSPIFYNRVKGLLEQEVAALGFPQLSIFRPSLLLGSRDENRPAEALGLRLSGLISPFLRGPLSALRPIPAGEVSAALVACAQTRQDTGTRIFHYADMQALLAENASPDA
jgi:uncharacterized protein YbjT (DUF2867 family)